MRVDIRQKAIDEQARSAFPDVERDKLGNAEPLVINNRRRRTETILNEMIDKMPKPQLANKSCPDGSNENCPNKKKKRGRQRGPRVQTYSKK